MTTPRTKLVTLAVSTTLALIAAWLVLRGRAAPSIGVIDQRASVEAVLLERQVAPRGLGPFELRPGLATLRREPVDEATVRRIFPMAPTLVYDAQQYYRYASNLDERVPFGGREEGAYRLRTNSLGYREDQDMPSPRPDVLVLATGDSHTDGVANNAESWPNRLESLLAESRPGRVVEVLNAGVQTYSFYHYLGSIERALPLAPQVVVTLCYGGNDFLEVLLLHHMFQRTVRPPRTAEYWAAFGRAPGVHNPELTQILWAAHHFERAPDEVDRALEAAAAVCAEIQRLCAENGARWIFAYLPSAYCIPWQELAAERARDLAALELTEASIARIGVLADRLLGILRERGVTVVDIRPDFLRRALAGERRPYWEEFHLDVRGLDLVARLLLPEVERALEDRR